MAGRNLYDEARRRDALAKRDAAIKRAAHRRHWYGQETVPARDLGAAGARVNATRDRPAENLPQRGATVAGNVARTVKRRTDVHGA